MESNIDLLAQQLASATSSSPSNRMIQRRYGTVTAVSHDDTGATFDVEVSGGTLTGVRATTNAVAANVGARVVVDTASNLSLITGVISQGKSTLGTLLWSGTWSSGTLTIPGLSNFTIFAGRINDWNLIIPMGISFPTDTYFWLSAVRYTGLNNAAYYIAGTRSGDTLNLWADRTGVGYLAQNTITTQPVTHFYGIA